MTPPQPYLIRAIFQWILDNTLSPYILVNAEKPNIQVPKEYIKNGQIIFNITPGIVDQLDISNESIQFKARFSGIRRRIYVPISAVLAIYAKENGRGMAFDKDENTRDENEGDSPPTPPKKPKLSIVK